jgi:cardiolipin synthase (CMP-forming)
VKLSALPNLLCVLRMVLAVPVVGAIVDQDYTLTLVLFLVAAITDGLDGWLAKRFDWSSELGKVLDPVADKLLLVSVFVALTLEGLVPLWLAATVVLRDVVIGAGAATYRVYFGPVRGSPTATSKLNTVLQISFVLALVTDAAWPAVPDPLLATLGAAMFVTTAVSGIDYVITYSRRAAAVARSRRPAA